MRASVVDTASGPDGFFPSSPMISKGDLFFLKKHPLPSDGGTENYNKEQKNR